MHISQLPNDVAADLDPSFYRRFSHRKHHRKWPEVRACTALRNVLVMTHACKISNELYHLHSLLPSVVVSGSLSNALVLVSKQKLFFFIFLKILFSFPAIGFFFKTIAIWVLIPRYQRGQECMESLKKLSIPLFCVAATYPRPLNGEILWWKVLLNLKNSHLIRVTPKLLLLFSLFRFLFQKLKKNRFCCYRKQKFSVSPWCKYRQKASE